MPRGPLVAALLRAARAQRISKATGAPIEEVAAAIAEKKLSRRRLFEGASALALASGVVPLVGCDSKGVPASAPLPPESARVAIVGGGIAGLHCAYRLAKAGISFDVYEADKSLGGRIRTDRTTFADGQSCEIGGELIDSSHATMIGLASELGIDLYDYETDDASLASIVGFFDGKVVTEADLLVEFAPIAAKMDEALATLKNPDAGVTRADPNGGEALDAQSVTAWLDGAGATGAIRKLLDVAFTIEFGLDSNENNALNMLLLISTGTDKLELFGDSDERFRAKTGNATFIEKLGAAIDPAHVKFDHRLAGAKKAADGRYTLSFERTGATPIEVTTEYVVFALPFTILRDVPMDIGLPPEKVSAIRDLGYGSNTKLMVGFSSRPWRTGASPSNGETYTDLPFQNTWETSRLQPGASGILTNFTGGAIARGVASDGTPESHRDAFLTDFDKLFPGAKAASNGKVVRAGWPTNPFTKASYSSYKVGQYTAISGLEGETFEKAYFCGEHTSSEAQGYMEGGAVTGKATADALIAAIAPKAAAASPIVVPRRRMFGLAFG